MHMKVLGKDFIIIGSQKVAVDLLEKRGANYSDRPHSEMHQLYVTLGRIRIRC